MITLHTWWKKSGVAYMSVCLANLARKLGYNSNILSKDVHNVKVHDKWDKLVIPDTDSRAQNILMSSKAVIWPELIWLDKVILAKASKSSTYLIPMWESIHRKDISNFGYYSSIVCPSIATRECFKRQGITNTTYIPYDPCVEKGKHKEFNERDIRFLLPIAGGEPRRNVGFIMRIMGRIMQDYYNVKLTVTYLSARWPPSAGEDLLRLRIAFRDRLTVIHNQSYEDHLNTYRSHDLTLWPTDQEGLGIIGLESISCGTPVIAWDIPPINEYLTNGVNSILLPCTVRHNWFGVVTACPDEKRFEDKLRGLIDKKEDLQALLNTTDGLPKEISQRFVEGWSDLFKGDSHQKITKEP